MSKKLENSEYDYIQDQLQSQTNNRNQMGANLEAIKKLEAQNVALINDNIQSQKDLEKFMQKLTKKYGKGGEISIDMNTKEITLKDEGSK
jgi:ribonuclease HI